MGSPEVSNFSVEYLLRSKASDETPQYNGVRDDHLYRAQHPVDYGYLPHAAEPRRGSRSRSRTVFTEIQTQQLELLFSRTDYPTPDEREELARSTGLSHEVIRVWFKNRRARRKNQNAPGSPNTNPAEEARNERTNERS
ncbi:dharma [Scleropages formosus]|uniref:dharma n=1 Tax=Scleropages formosus TaxID=113540 RepID=UPI0008790C9E|nr:homeobox protein MIXL1-like [Scleropages formosus]